jgi:aromatic ring-opening dioxygenase LigB subunit
VPLIFACVVPHAGVALPELASDPAVGAKSRATMAAIGAELAALRPETVVILTPHGVTIHGAIGVAITAQAAGSLGLGGAVELLGDQELAFALADGGIAAGLPVLPYWFGDGTLPLDWSTIVPLRYLGAGFRPRPRLVVVGPSASVPGPQLVAFGRALRAALDASPRRVALVASVDQAHTHTEDGPYGYDSAAAVFDAMLQEMFEEGRLDRLLELDEGLVAAAMPDSVQSLLVLHGALGEQSAGCTLRAYERFGYFSGICATFELAPSRLQPVGAARRRARKPGEADSG